MSSSLRVIADITGIRDRAVTPDDAGMFGYETLRRLAAAHPESSFVFLGPRRGGAGRWPLQVTLLPVLTPVHGTWSLARRQKGKLPSLARQHGAEVWLALNGLLPGGGLPACLLLAEECPGALAKGDTPLEKYRRRKLREALSAARVVATLSAAQGRRLTESYGLAPEKLRVLPPGVNEEFRAFSWEEREQVKVDHTDGREFLLYNGVIHPQAGIVDLLKAFTILKKKLQSNILLVLAGPLHASYGEFPELLRTYHYRADVRWLAQLTPYEVVRLTGAAYAQCIPSARRYGGTAALQAMRALVPVIAASGGSAEEVAGEAGLYFGEGEVEQLGERLCAVYKDEDLRARLIAAAAEGTAGYSWERTAGELWEALLLAAGREK